MLLPIVRNRCRPVSVFGDPFDAFDRITRLFEDGGASSAGPAVGCNVDVREDEGHYYFVAELPGLSKDEIDITLEDGVLTISGEKKNEHAEEKNGYHLRERGYGKFSRSFRLPTEVNPDKVGAHLKDGLLTLTLDKAEQIKPKKIEVKAG